MKRKLAFLLAGAISVSAMPMNAFAEPLVTGTPAVTRLSRSVILAPGRTAFLEPGANASPNVSGEVSNSDYISHWVEGGNFNIVFQEDHPIDTPVQFTVDLDNAEWFFRGSGSGDTGTLGSATFNSANGSWDPSTRIYTRTAGSASELAYTLQVSAGNPSRATVTITEPARSGARAAENDVVAAANIKEDKEKKEKPESSASPTSKPEVETKEAPTKETDEKIDKASKKEDKADKKLEKKDKTEKLDKIEKSAKPEKTAKPGSETSSVAVSSIQVDAMSPFADFTHMNSALQYISEAEGYIADANAAIALAGDIESVETPVTNARTAISNARTEIDGDATVVNAYDELELAYDELIVALGALTAMEVTDNQDPLETSGANFDALDDALGLAVAALGVADGILDAIVSAPPVTSGGVRNGEIVSIPLVVRTLDENVDSSIRVSQASPVNIQGYRRVFSQATQTGLTTTSISSPRSGRDRIEIPSIGIFENRIGSLPVSGTFELVAPSGFHFANLSGNVLALEGGLTEGVSWTSSMELRNDATVLRVTYSDLVKSSTMTGTLAITNLALVASNADNVREGDIYLNVRNVGSPAVVTPQRVLAGTVADWGVNIQTIGTAPELVSGRLRGIERTDVVDQHHRAATVRVEESIANAWWSQRSTTFTLPEQVRVRKVEFSNVRNVSNYDVLQGSFYNDRNRAASANVRVNDNVVTLSGLQTNNTARASFEMDLWLNIESGFEGDINLEIGGSALTDNANNNQSVTIASAISPVRLDADVTNVRLGYQFVPVGNFRIIENVPGALIANEQVFVSLTDNNFADMHIASGFDWDITQGDLRVRNMRTGTNLWLGNNQNNRNNVNLSFEVERQSTEPSEIEFSNVQVRLGGNVPISNQAAAGRGYDLVVWGPAIAANFEGIMEDDSEINRNDFFREPGIRTNFVNVEEGSTNTNGTLTNVVRVTANSPIIRVNNEEMIMDTAPFVSTRSNSMMVPVRFISMGLGVESHRVMWSPDTSTVTVDAGERIIQFQTNSSIMRINGIEVPMLNANGEPVYSEVRDERAFIPFRALADALNIFIDWDSATATATFDPTRPSSRAQSILDLEGRTIAQYGNYNVTNTNQNAQNQPSNNYTTNQNQTNGYNYNTNQNQTNGYNYNTNQNQTNGYNYNTNQNQTNGYNYNTNQTNGYSNPSAARTIINGVNGARTAEYVTPSSGIQAQLMNRIQSRTPGQVMNRTNR